MQAINKRAEIEFLKVQVVVNAIINVGNSLSGGSSGGDAFQKSFDALKGALLPHWAEQTDRKAGAAKQTLMDEVNKGPLKVKVVGKEKRRR